MIRAKLMKQRYPLYLFLLTILTVFTASSYAESLNNIIFSLQRKTYVEGEKSISVGLRNAEQSPYLVQANMQWLDNDTGQKDLTKRDETPFIITPPLYKLMPGQYYEWRLLFASDTNKLPKDRESIYLARFLLIPSVQKSSEDNISMAILREFNFKVYYRPKTLEKLTIENVQDKISFKLAGNKLIVSNNSPIFVSIDKLVVGTATINDEQLIKPLPPFGEQHYQLPAQVQNSEKVKWNLLDENSFPLKEQFSEISSS